jgi:hypothetical protein
MIITDMVGQKLSVGSRVVVHGTKGNQTGRVTNIGHLLVSVQMDDLEPDFPKWRRAKPWHLVVYGEEFREANVKSFSEERRRVEVAA